MGNFERPIFPAPIFFYVIATSNFYPPNYRFKFGGSFFSTKAKSRWHHLYFFKRPNKRIFICLHTTSYYLDLHILLCTFISLVFMNKLIRQMRSENLMLKWVFWGLFPSLLLQYVPSSYASEQISVHKFYI